MLKKTSQSQKSITFTTWILLALHVRITVNIDFDSDYNPHADRSHLVYFSVYGIDFHQV